MEGKGIATLGSDEILNWTRQAIHDVSTSLGIGSDLEFDARRIATTIKYLETYELWRDNVVEIGSLEYLASQVLWRYFPSANPVGTKNDLRTEPLGFLDNTIDSLICLEVIEHLSDVPYHHATTLTGLFFFLEEVYRVLKVGGKALFSTPNAASLWTIQRAFLQQPPMMYEWHFREFTVDEIRRIMESVGLEVVILETEYVWHEWDFEPIKQFITNQGYSINDRGDDIFIIVQKPSKRFRKDHGLALPI